MRLADGTVEGLRLIGLDILETLDWRKPVQWGRRKVSARAHEMFYGKTVVVDAESRQGEWDC